MSLPSTMRAVIFKGPGEIAVESRPVPVIQSPTDVVLKIRAAALCGSDLHFYRGHQKIPTGFIVGHGFTETIVQMGSAVNNFEIGDEVVVPFFTACGNCFYCTKGQASRCDKGLLFDNSAGTNSIDGGQAEYVRVPFASTTLVKAPPTIPHGILVLMADIFPTGYFAASRFLKGLSVEDSASTVAVVIGCGPVGICAIVAALTMVKTVYAIDPDESPASIGAIPIPAGEDPATFIKAATNGRGADVVMEVVGRKAALLTAIEICRPWGQISSVGVHTETLDLAGSLLYGKNITLSFGRCPVRSIFEEALAVLVQEQDKVKFLCDKQMSIEEAPEAFKIFEQQKVHKIIFKMS